MKKFCVLKLLATTAFLCALTLFPRSAFGQDAVQAEAAREAAVNDTYASHLWARRALNTRYSIDRSSVAPAYHAGMLAFANTLMVYGDVGYETYIERTDIEPLGDDAFYQHDRFAASAGLATPIGARLGLGAELKHSSMSMETSPINYGDDTFSAALNAGIRLSRRTALGLSAGVVAVETREGPPSQSAQDAFGSLGLVWAEPDTDIWAGFRIVSDVRFDRSHYYLGVLPSEEDARGFETIIIDMAVSPRTEAFMRAGLLNGRLLLSFVGSVDWLSIGVREAGTIYREAGDLLFLVQRDLAVEFLITQRISSRIGYHRTDLNFSPGDFEFEELAGKNKSTTGSYTTVTHGVFGGLSFSPGAFLLDINASYRQAPLMSFPWLDDTIDLIRLGLHFVWER